MLGKREGLDFGDRFRAERLMIRLVLSIAFLLAVPLVAADKRKLILDADTANEIDDLHAIARMLRQEKFDLIGLNSAQWFHYLGGERSVYASQVLNIDLLRIMGRLDLPAPLGADEPMGKPWGGTDAKDSAAAQFIIEQAKAMPDGEKLIVVCIGASTNLASAIKLAPEIAPWIEAHVLGFKFDLVREVWDKSEFNIRRDLNAADFLLNQSDLELHVMPTTVASDLKFDQDETFVRQEKMGELGAYLTARWIEHNAEAKRWTMWDLALVEAMLDPDTATKRKAKTPPENAEREIWIYDSIDPEAMAKAYWAAVE